MPGAVRRRTALRWGMFATAAGLMAGCGAPGPEARLTEGDRLMTAGYTVVHDPCMLREGDYYYVYSTGYPGVGNGNIQMRVSRDLVHWDFIGTVFPQIPAWIQQRIPGISNLWAPDLSHYRGRYQLYYACSLFGTKTSCIALATNTTLDPNAPGYRWVDEGEVISSNGSAAYNAIDPNFVAAGGRPWLDFGSYNSGIQLVSLEQGTRKPAAKPHLYPLAYRPVPPHALEAPFLIQRDRYFYLFTSFGKCCVGVQSTYRIKVGRSANIERGYVDATGEPLLLGGGTLVLGNEGPMIGPGGQSVCQTGEADYLVYHYYNALENGSPALQIRKIAWSAQGWPGVGPPIVPVPGAAGASGLQ